MLISCGTYFYVLFEHTIGVGANTFLLLCRAENNWIHIQAAAFLNVLLPGGLKKVHFYLLKNLTPTQFTMLLPNRYRPPQTSAQMPKRCGTNISN
jgi:hypothetical protein